MQPAPRMLIDDEPDYDAISTSSSSSSSSSSPRESSIESASSFADELRCYRESSAAAQEMTAGYRIDQLLQIHRERNVSRDPLPLHLARRLFPSVKAGGFASVPRAPAAPSTTQPAVSSHLRRLSARRLGLHSGFGTAATVSIRRIADRGDLVPIGASAARSQVRRIEVDALGDLFFTQTTHRISVFTTRAALDCRVKRTRLGTQRSIEPEVQLNIDTAINTAEFIRASHAADVILGTRRDAGSCLERFDLEALDEDDPVPERRWKVLKGQAGAHVTDTSTFASMPSAVLWTASSGLVGAVDLRAPDERLFEPFPQAGVQRLALGSQQSGHDWSSATALCGGLGPTGHHVCVGSSLGVVRVWDLRCVSGKGTQPMSTHQLFTGIRQLSANATPVTPVCQIKSSGAFGVVYVGTCDAMFVLDWHAGKVLGFAWQLPPSRSSHDGASTPSAPRMHSDVCRFAVMESEGLAIMPNKHFDDGAADLVRLPYEGSLDSVASALGYKPRAANIKVGLAATTRGDFASALSLQSRTQCDAGDEREDRGGTHLLTHSGSPVCVAAVIQRASAVIVGYEGGFIDMIE